MRRTAIVGAILAILASTYAMGCTPSGGAQKDPGGPAAEKAPIKIGAVLSLTGTYAGLGEPEKNVLDMEVARINEAGGVNGAKIEVVIEDDATDPAKAQAATTKLIEQDDVVAIIGATGTGQTMAMRGDVDRAVIPQVSIAGGTAITAQFDKLVFQTPWSNSIVVPFTLEFMKSKGISKVAVISDSGGFGKDGAAVIAAAAPKAGLTIVANEAFNPGDTDMTTQLTKIQAAKPDAVLMVSAGKEAATIAKNMKQLGMAQPLYGTHGNARKEFIAGAADAAEGVRFAAGKILVPDAYGKDTKAYEVATDFTARYTEKYGKAPDTFAGHAYDALYLIVEAAKRIDGDVTADALRTELEATQGFVGIGGTFNMSATDHNGMTEQDLVMYEIQKGAWVLAK